MLRSLHNWNTFHATKMSTRRTETILRRNFLHILEREPFSMSPPAMMVRVLKLMAFQCQFLACLQQISCDVLSVQFSLFVSFNFSRSFS